MANKLVKNAARVLDRVQSATEFVFSNIGWIMGIFITFIIAGLFWLTVYKVIVWRSPIIISIKLQSPITYHPIITPIDLQQARIQGIKEQAASEAAIMQEPTPTATPTPTKKPI